MIFNELVLQKYIFGLSHRKIASKDSVKLGHSNAFAYLPMKLYVPQYQIRYAGKTVDSCKVSSLAALRALFFNNSTLSALLIK